MKPWIIIGIILAVLVLFNLLRVGACAEYSEEGFMLKLAIGCLRIKLVPKTENKPKQKKEKPEKKKNEKKKGKKKRERPDSAGAESKNEEKKGGSLKKIMAVLPTVFQTLGRFFRFLRIDILKVRYTVGTEDPCDTALQYGIIGAGLGPLEPWLKKLLHVRKWDVAVRPDFEREEPLVYLKAQATIAIWQIIYIVIKLDFKAIFGLLK